MWPTRRLRKQTGEASAFIRENGHRDTVAPDGRAVDPWDAILHRPIIDQVAQFKVIRSVKDHVRPTEQALGVAGRQIGDNGLNPDA